MTTNNQPIAAWAPSTALHKLASRHNNAPCILTDTPAEFNDVALIRLSDYERLQAAYEEELFCVRQDRDAHFGELIRALEQVDTLQAEVEALHKEGGLVERLTKLLPEIDDALEDLELHGTHSDRGYVKLKAWYRRMASTINAIDAAMEGDTSEGS